MKTRITRTQLTRRLVQLAFLTITFVGVFVVKGNAEAWCPFGGVETLYNYATEGNLLCSLGVSNIYILVAVLALVLLTRRSFCGYVCPIGALSEWLQRGAELVGIKPVTVRGPLDRVLGLLKYAVLAIILFITWRAAELHFRAFDPCYALLSRHGEDITYWAYIVAGAIVLASLLIIFPFCRWLCPLAAVFSPFSRFGLTRVKRDSENCNNCGACARRCPMAIDVDRQQSVTQARCISCLKCVDACPHTERGALAWGPAWNKAARWPQAVIVGLILLCVSGAVATTYVLPLPSFVHTHAQSPATTATTEMQIHDLTCRGRATLLVYYLERDDEFALPGYWRLEAWPGISPARVRIIYDPAQADAEMFKQAITEAYFDGQVWRPSPFRIEGYDPYGLDLGPK